jgi:hypothetical protein
MENNAGNAEIADNAGNGKRQTPSAKRIPISTKERSLFLLLLTDHHSHSQPFPAFLPLIVTEMLQKSRCGAFVRNID